MEVVCRKCNQVLASVVAVDPLNVQIHCPYCGEDQGFRVEPPAPAPAPAVDPNSTPAS